MPAPHYRIGRSGSIRRREFLLVTGSLSAAALWSTRSLGAVLAAPKFSDNPFQLGVASGDPLPDGVVLWTRLAPKPLEGGGMPDEAVQVEWQVADDEQMAKVVKKGTTVANPDWAHSVHVEVQGLRPDRWYFYQFRAGGETSPVGRTRTTPAAETTPERLRFAFASCQHFETGYYTAYEHMLREHPDLVIHLGDYIYEGAGGDDKVRRHAGPKLTTVDDYRLRHAQYKTDRALQAMHAAAPWLMTWDDHEFENNYADLVPEDPKPLDAFREQRACAYKAYYEHMPLRAASCRKARTCRCTVVWRTAGSPIFTCSTHGNIAPINRVAIAASHRAKRRTIRRAPSWATPSADGCSRAFLPRPRIGTCSRSK